MDALAVVVEDEGTRRDEIIDRPWMEEVGEDSRPVMLKGVG